MVIPSGVFSKSIDSIPPDIRYDKSHVEVRTPKAGKIEDYKNKRDFKYDRKLTQKPNHWWYKFIYWLNRKLIWVITESLFFKILFYLTVFVISIALILKIMNYDISRIFSRKGPEKKFAYQTGKENIHELNLDELIAQHVREKQFRLAIRYMYLKVLKELNNAEIIEWKINKTNRDYIQEMEDMRLYEDFRDLSGMFNFVWYGNFQLNENYFQQIQDKFSNFYSQINHQHIA